MVALAPNRACPLRYMMHNGLRVGFSQHAVKRAAQRGIDLEARLRSLHGVPLRKYKRHGVVAVYRPRQQFLKIVTVWT